MSWGCDFSVPEEGCARVRLRRSGGGMWRLLDKLGVQLQHSGGGMWRLDELGLRLWHSGEGLWRLFDELVPALHLAVVIVSGLTSLVDLL